MPLDIPTFRKKGPNWLWLRFKQALPTLEPKPGLHTVPDMTGQHVGMDFWVADIMHENTSAIPRAGDVIIKLFMCGMGMTVKEDTRWRVSTGTLVDKAAVAEPAPIYCVEALNEKGERDTFRIG